MKDKGCKKGFTLIELLVVVLIIGILAAVAMPQYKKAVLKARFSRVIPVVRSVVTSSQLILLNNGGISDSHELSDFDQFAVAKIPGCTYDTNLGIMWCRDNDLAIDIGSGVDPYTQNPSRISVVGHLLDNRQAGVLAYAESIQTDERLCIAAKSSKIAQDICQSMGGKNPREQTHGHTDKIKSPVLVHQIP